MSARLGPDDRRAMLACVAVGHRQDGERAAGQELLLRHAAMRPLVARHQHDRDLIVRPGARADAGVLAHRAEAALGRGDQPRREPSAALERDLDLVGAARRVERLVGRDQLDAWAGLQPPQHCGAQETVLDDPAHRRGLALVLGRLAMIEMQEQRTGAPVVAGVGDADVEDRLGAARQLVPHAERLEQPLAGVGDRRGAAVEAGLGQRVQAAPGRPARSAGPTRRRPGPAGCRSGRRR